MKGRTYGETVCVCGVVFTRRSPTQLFHSNRCRNRLTLCRGGKEEWSSIGRIVARNF
jgi:hypothetical protein